jgi:hypothetical protein
MRITLAVLADYANVSREGKLNIMGIFDTIYAVSYPTQHPTMNLVMRVSAHYTECDRPHKLEVKFSDSDGHQIFALAGQIVATGQPGRITGIDHVLAINNLAFTKPGDYAFDILVDDNHAANVPLHVITMDPATVRVIGRPPEGPPELPGGGSG